MSKEKYYITTPIYYPSGKWHLGTAYTTVICDAIARFRRMQGKEVFYLTGTDEHGKKIAVAAEEKGLPVKVYIDGIVDELKELWKVLDISYDKFIRTTDAYHKEGVKKIFEKLYNKGDIYKNEYEGMYCIPCESFWTKSQLKDGKCPDCGREVKATKEESYFFRLSKYQDRLIELIEKNPEFLQPKSRQNEMLNNFLKCGLQDLSVSRTSFDWGVQVPFDPKHVVYVWIDALSNYITALGYASDDDKLFKKFWPADLHMMGKEIVRFHSIIWPALLMALDLPLPKKVYGHGWLLFGEDKMSKSKGNVVDPIYLAQKYSVDAVRYYLLREIPFGQDGNYTNRTFLMRINVDLANDLGNLVSRTTAMITQYFGGKIPTPSKVREKEDIELIEMCEGLLGKITEQVDNLLIPEALESIFKVIQRANKYIDETKPWALAKEDGDKDRLKSVLYNLSEAIRFASCALQPFLTQTPAKIFEKLGISENKKLQDFASIKSFGKIKPDTLVSKGEALFLRLDVEKELKIMDTYASGESGDVERKEKETKIIDKKENKEDKKMTENTVCLSELSIDEFEKVALKVGKVVTCQKVEKAEKLLCLTVDLGEGRVRTIVSGIAKWYTAEEMVGKQIVVVANLKPAKLRGIISEGMILCASDDEENLCIVAPEKKIKIGSEVR